MAPSDRTDFTLLQTLAASAQQGDKDAYQKLLEGLVSYLRAIVRYRVGSISDVEDVVQECLLGVHKSLHTYRPSRRLKPWVDAIIRYKTADHFRAQSRRREFATGDAIEVTIPAPEPNNDVESSVIDADQAWALVGQLPEGMREPVLLTKRDGLSTHDAAARLGIAEPALRKRISRAYRKLAVLYEKTYGPSDDE